MPVLTGRQGENLTEDVSEDETIVHSHTGGGDYCLITLYDDPEDDDEEGPFSCIFGDLVVDYPENTTVEYNYFHDVLEDVYVCSLCKWKHEEESQVKSHFTRNHGKEEEQEENGENGEEDNAEEENDGEETEE